MNKIILNIKSFLNNKSSKLINNFIFIGLAICLFMMTLSSLYYLILFIPYIYFMFKKKDKSYIYIIILLILCISIHYVIYEIYYYKSINSDKEIKSAKVIDIKEEDDYIKITAKFELMKVYIYLNDDIDLSIGDIIRVDGDKKEILSNTIPNGFDYKDYLKHQKVVYSVNAKSVSVLRHSFSIFYFKYLMNKYVESFIDDDNSLMIIKALVLGDNSLFDDSFSDGLSKNGIVHLFAVSGLHVSLLISLLTKVLDLFNIKDRYKNSLLVLFLLFYLVITSFSPSIVRASLMYFLGLLNKTKLKSIFSSMDILTISFCLLVVINPYYCFQTGFVLSYLASFSIILLSPLIQDKKNYLQIIYLSIISNIFTLPVVINISYEINLLSPFLNVLYISFMSMILLPFTFIVFVFPIFAFLYKYLIIIFLKMVDLTSYLCINLRLPHLNEIVIIIYILLILAFLYFYSKKRIRKIIFIVFVSFLIIYSNISLFNINDSIDFLYVNEGDSCLIRTRNKNILIDTGDGYHDEVLTFLKSKGIKKLDILIITHDHSDHYGGLDSILENIKVKKLIVSKYDSAYYTGYKIAEKVDYLDEIVIDKIKFIVLNPSKINEEENDNSLVLLMQGFSKNVLFMGDVTSNLEMDVANIINDNNYNVDIIKIGHHGSSTSTSLEFLKSINARYACIMSGRKRVGVFPSNDVINNLNSCDMTIFRTDYLYSYKLIFKKQKLYLKTN